MSGQPGCALDGHAMLWTEHGMTCVRVHSTPDPGAAAMSSTVLVDPLPPAKKVDGGPAGLAAVRGRFSRLNRAVVIGSAIVLFFILLAIFATPLEHLTENNPYSEHPEALGASSIPQGWGGGISAEHWFGVTPLRGVDLFSIVAHGARISLGIGLASSVVS
ncbi:MAG TPA: hypothetical protein VGC18_06740, partial [Lacisediminihabitans sp.]